MAAISASHSRAADSTSVSSTACRSKVERLMTLSTSAVAVCCCSDSANLRALTQLVEQARVLDGDDGLGGEVFDQLDLLVGERAHLLAVDGDGTDQLVVLEHRHDDMSSARPPVGPKAVCSASAAASSGVDQLFGPQHAVEGNSGRRRK